MLFIYLIFTTKVTQLKSEKALIFEPFSDRIRDADEPDEKLALTVFTNCPASTKQEKQFDEKVSLGGNSIFSRQFYPPDGLIGNLQMDICDSPFKPVMLYDSQCEEYAIGYELYCDNIRKIRFVKWSERYYHRYRSVKAIKNQTDYEIMNRTTLPLDFVVRYDDGHDVKFNFTDGSRTLVFHWIQVLKMKLSGYNKRTTNFLGYKYNPRGLSNKCEDYDRSDQDIYSEKNQEIHLNNLLPPESLSETDLKKLHKSCGQIYGCLKNSQIAPIQFFETRATRLASCSYQNMIPVWKTIAEGQLRKVDVYITALDRTIFPEKIFGVSDVLKMKKTTNRYKLQELFLSDSNHRKIRPVPKIIYRIIEHHRGRRPKHAKSYEWQLIKYAAVIVIHNDPTPFSSDERLCTKQSLLSGWNKITNKDSKIGFTYVCPMTIELNEKLKVYDNITSETFQPLHLDAVPYSHNTTHYDPYDRIYYRDHTYETNNVFERELKYFLSV